MCKRFYNYLGAQKRNWDFYWVTWVITYYESLFFPLRGNCQPPPSPSPQMCETHLPSLISAGVKILTEFYVFLCGVRLGRIFLLLFVQLLKLPSNFYSLKSTTLVGPFLGASAPTSPRHKLHNRDKHNTSNCVRPNTPKFNFSRATNFTTHSICNFSVLLAFPPSPSQWKNCCTLLSIPQTPFWNFSLQILHRRLKDAWKIRKFPRCLQNFASFSSCNILRNLRSKQTFSSLDQPELFWRISLCVVLELFFLMVNAGSCIDSNLVLCLDPSPGSPKIRIRKLLDDIGRRTAGW